MAASSAKKATTPRQPERKWGPFPGGLGVAVWLNQAEMPEGTRYFRSITINPRRYRDPKTQEWKDSSSLRSTDVPSLLLALHAAYDYIHSTPLPGQALEDDSFDPELLEQPPE